MTAYKALVDVCIFQDVIKRRKGWQESLKVLRLFEGDDYAGWISSLTKPILYFLSVRTIHEKGARELATEMTRHFSEIPLRADITKKALDNPLPEYEDNIQLESALQFHLDAVITRNKRHYQQKKMAVYTPEEFIGMTAQMEVSKTISVPFLDLKAQHHAIYNEIDDRMTDIIANTGFILGKHVAEFEERFAKMQGAAYCLGVSSGTDALHVALLALGIGPGDRVAVPVNTFIATAEAVSLAGAAPVFVDCDAYYNMDTDKLEDILKRHAEEDRPLKAVIPVHLYGQPADMSRISALAEAFNLAVVEDACQAHLAQYQRSEVRGQNSEEEGGWKRVGTAGAFGAFSFYPGKNLGAYGEAGALVTHDEVLYQRAKMFRQHGEIERYHHQVVGHNYRMAAFQGAVLATKLGYLKEWTEKRQKNAALYSQLLNAIDGIETPRERAGTECVYHLYVIQSDHRDGLQQYLGDHGIATGLHYPVPLHLQEAYRFMGLQTGDFPCAEKAAGRILSLPMYPELTEGQIRYVCDTIRNYVAGRK